MEHTTAPDCCWPGCRAPQTSDDLKLCGPHAFHAYIRFRNLLEARMEEPEPEVPQFKDDVVYYLMVGPTTVKIGTTRYLPRRI